MTTYETADGHRVVPSVDHAGHRVWHVIAPDGGWVQSFATRRDAVYSLTPTCRHDNDAGCPNHGTCTYDKVTLR